MAMTWGADTHVGRRRDHNEDAYLAAPELGVFAVCDGMGGHASGEVASRLAVDELRSFFSLTASDRDCTWPFKFDKASTYDENRLVVAAKLANRTVLEHARANPRCRGMGTTFVGLSFTPDGRVIVAHAGDSRAYRLRGESLERLTADHSLVEEYLRAGRITPEEAERFPQKNIILRALGQAEQLDVDVATHDARSGDLFLVCSDGLSGMVDDPKLEALLRTWRDDPSSCVRHLIDAANGAGGHDNITAIVLAA
jgi:serine/threonine protein phosphatase PrpC